MKSIKISRVFFNNILANSRDGEKVRGFFANKFRDCALFHNHTENGFIYSYPKIQYKIIEKRPMLLGIENGAEELKKIVLKLDELQLQGKNHSIDQLIINNSIEEFGCCDEILQYKFLTPYLALNQENHKKYNTLNSDLQKDLLSSIIKGNIISVAKGIEHQITDKILIKYEFEKMYVMVKNQKMLAFSGCFFTNVIIPDYFGIGKSVSKGFGIIKKVL